MKRIIVLFLFFSISCTLKAQFNFFRKPRNESKVTFGFKAGVNLSNMNFNKGFPAPSEPVEASWKTGYVLGLLMDVPIIRKLHVQPEYLYLQTNGENKNTGINHSMSYVSLPVLFKYNIVKTLSIMGGPQFDLLIKATETDNGTQSVTTHDTEERSIFAVAGLEFNITESFSLNARYLNGFNHIGIGQRSAVTEFKYEMAQITASIKF